MYVVSCVVCHVWPCMTVLCFAVLCCAVVGCGSRLWLGGQELPDYIQEGLEVHYASEYDDVFEVAFAAEQ